MRKHPVVPVLAIESAVPALLFGCGGEVTPIEAAAVASTEACDNDGINSYVLLRRADPRDRWRVGRPEAPSATSRPMP
jgi:hypothetical protein